ncbi:MAG TPA: prepilin peptidase [Planctomycetota bacterium]|nr:prepilin peptidase [Planctomycetota bacterium]
MSSGLASSLPPEFAVVWWRASWSVLGLVVGSFLNVAIHRLPLEGESVTHPRRSRCPSCRRTLTWRENIPLVSWVYQRGRCAGCGWRIPWRYPLVEVLTALLWLATAWVTPPQDWALLLVRLLAVSGLVVATFVDFERYEIPDEISIGGMVLAPVVSLWVPRLHEWTWVARRLSEGPEVSRFGALAGCIAGMLAGGGVLLAIGWFGKRLYGRDAMGLGDVKLLAGAGGFIGPGGVVLALMIASLAASVAGIGNILRFLALSQARTRARGGRRSLRRSLRSARVAGRYVPFGPYLALGIVVALLYWSWFRRPY